MAGAPHVAVRGAEELAERRVATVVKIRRGATHELQQGVESIAVRSPFAKLPTSWTWPSPITRSPRVT